MSPAPLPRLTWRQFLAQLSAGPGWHGPVTDHFDGRQFFSPWHETDHTFWEVLKWRFTRRPGPWPHTHPEPAPLSAPPAPPASGEMTATFLGHACWLFQFPGFTLLTDPVWSHHCSPLPAAGTRRVRPPALTLDQLPRIDAVLLSHNHFDHLDVPTLLALEERFSPHLITGLGNRAFLAKLGLTRASELDWWDTLRPARSALDLTFTPAQHWSHRGTAGKRTTLWGGFHLRHGGFTLYFAGDTGYAPIFTPIHDRLGPPDLALLPIGAYLPRDFMRASHMDPADAVRAHRELHARQSLGFHFGTWALADEGMDTPLHDLATALTAADLPPEKFRAPTHGETLRLPLH